MSRLCLSTSTYHSPSHTFANKTNKELRVLIPHSVTYPFLSSERLLLLGKNSLCLLLLALMFVVFAYFCVWLRSTVQPTYFISCWKAAASK